jgi:signal transduction histidine kinase
VSFSVSRWWRRRSLRARVTVITSAGLAVALVAAALLLRGALQATLTRGVDGTARQGAREVAMLASTNRLPDPVPVVAGTLTVQVLGADGRIVDASPGADRLVSLLPVAQAAAAARTGHAVLMDGRPFGIPYLMRVVAVPANGHEIVLSAAEYTQVSDSMTALSRALLVGTPLLLLLLAGATWLVVGSTLRPIAALRRGAQVVTATGQARELPVPEARDEVRTLAITLNDMLARLDAAQRRQRSLVSDTAHELRSPIASIRAQLEVALDHPGQQDWSQTAQDVLADTLRLARLAEDLLVLARLDEYQVRAAPGQPVDLAALVTEEAERSAGGRVPVTARAAGPCVVTGEVEGLRRMLRNLIENALRYAKSGVEVAARREAGEAVLTVSDDGPGIPPADRERAFDRFVRLDDARSRDEAESGGAGLGLAIVRAIARTHGGSAYLEGAAPGLRAVVRLPAAPGQPAGTTTARLSAPPTAAPAPVGTPATPAGPGAAPAGTPATPASPAGPAKPATSPAPAAPPSPTAPADAVPASRDHEAGEPPGGSA